MDKMKKYLLYIVLLILFALFSEFLIEVGFNSTYKAMDKEPNELSQIVITQAESTKINGRVRGIIENNKKPIEAKYLKIDFYSQRGINMGSRYIEIDKTKQEQPFEVFFKLNNVSKYAMSLVNEKDSKGEIEFIPKDLSRTQVIIGTIVTMLIFWA